jgi:hypothetical protein
MNYQMLLIGDGCLLLGAIIGAGIVYLMARNNRKYIEATLDADKELKARFVRGMDLIKRAKHLLLMLIAVSAIIGVLAPSAMASQVVHVAITGQNQWSPALQMKGPGMVIVDDTSSMSMTVSLQISIDGTTWINTGDTWTAGGVDILGDGAGLYFRVGVATGDYSSGTATVYLVCQPRK